jgi:hypothetical protein
MSAVPDETGDAVMPINSYYSSTRRNRVDYGMFRVLHTLSDGMVWVLRSTGSEYEKIPMYWQLRTATTYPIQYVMH